MRHTTCHPNALRIARFVATATLLSLAPGALHGQGSASELVGLWEAKLRFGPDVRGPLTIERAASAWRAEIAGVSTAARILGDTITFTLPDGRGAFRGLLAPERGRGEGDALATRACCAAGAKK